MKTFEFWFDFGSPAPTWRGPNCRHRARRPAPGVYRPMLLGGVFQATGNRRLSRAGQGQLHVGRPGPLRAPLWRADEQQPALSHQHADAHARRGGPATARTCALRCIYVRRHVQAIWVTPQNLNDPATVGAVLQEAGFDPQALLALTQDAEVKEALKAVTQEAVDRGRSSARPPSLWAPRCSGARTDSILSRKQRPAAASPCKCKDKPSFLETSSPTPKPVS
jgi:2-hydroxychromene-2-carboxylate isomerase